jgi:hypothetical protein
MRIQLIPFKRCWQSPEGGTIAHLCKLALSSNWKMVILKEIMKTPYFEITA